MPKFGDYTADATPDLADTIVWKKSEGGTGRGTLGDALALGWTYREDVQPLPAGSYIDQGGTVAVDLDNSYCLAYLARKEGDLNHVVGHASVKLFVTGAGSANPIDVQWQLVIAELPSIAAMAAPFVSLYRPILWSGNVQGLTPDQTWGMDANGALYEMWSSGPGSPLTTALQSGDELFIPWTFFAAQPD